MAWRARVRDDTGMIRENEKVETEAEADALVAMWEPLVASTPGWRVEKVRAK
jgi:hypothetical protein